MKTLPLIFFLLSTTFLYAQVHRDLLVPYRQGDLYGYCNRDLEIKIEPQFEEARFFAYNRAVVKKEGKYGYINRNGEWVIEPQFKQATDFRYDRANVVRRRKTFQIDTTGRRLKKRPPIMGYRCGHGIYHMTPVDSFAIVTPKGYRLIFRDYFDPAIDTYHRDTTTAIFDTVAPFGRFTVLLKKDGKYGIWDTYFDPLDDSIGVEFVYDKVEKRPADIVYQQGNFEIAKVKKGSQFGCINDMGKVTVPVKYLNLEFYNWNYVWVEYAPNKWGYVDSVGREYFARK